MLVASSSIVVLYPHASSSIVDTFASRPHDAIVKTGDGGRLDPWSWRRLPELLRRLNWGVIACRPRVPLSACYRRLRAVMMERPRPACRGIRTVS